MKQSGFAHILLIFVLLAAIILGVYLVQTQTNLFPQAAQNDSKKTIQQLTDQLLSQSKQLKSATNKNYIQTLKNNTKSIAARRKLELKNLAVSDPAAFLKVTTLLGKEKNLAPDISNEIEKQVEVKGLLRAVHSDDFKNKKSGSLEFYIDQPEIKKSSGSFVNRKFYKVNFVNPPAAKVIGSIVTINGVALDSNLIVETGDQSGRKTNLKVEDKKVLGVTTDIMGDQKTAVFLVNFQNDTRQIISNEQVNNLMFNNSDSVDKYFREVSFNKASFSGNVYGWLTLPTNSTSCDYYDWALQADSIAQQNNIDLSNFKYRIYAFPTGVCPYGGIGEIGGLGAQFYRSWVFYPDYVGIYKHELGHNLGVHHANGLSCANPSETNYQNCTNTEYADITDTMGDAYGGTQFNAPHKVATGWINSTNVSEAINTTGTFNVYNSETETTLPQVLKMLTPYTNYGGSSNDYYYISYRQPLGFDSVLRPETTGGVSIHLWNEVPSVQTKLIDNNNSSLFGNYTDASLADNQTFNDPNSGIKIKQISHDGIKAVVEFERVNIPTGNISASATNCNIPIGSTSCTVQIRWTTQNVADPKIIIRENNSVFASGVSGVKDAQISGSATFDLFNGSNLMGSVNIFTYSLPEAPKVTLNVNCIDDNYDGDGVYISWRNPFNPILFANISTDPDWNGITGSKYVGSYPIDPTDTTAPNGFSYFDKSSNSQIPYKLNPDQTYYVWLSNNNFGPAKGFSIPRCIKPSPTPTTQPTPTPTVIPTPTPTLQPTPSPVACNPRPNIGRSTQMTANGMVVNLTSATNSNTPNNPMSKIDFTKFANGTVTINNQLITAPLVYTLPAANTSQVSFLIKQVTYGQPTTISMQVYDTCGPYSLFFGGGTSAGWPKI